MSNSQITQASTSDTFCAASNSDLAVETQSTGSRGAITAGVLPKRNTLDHAQSRCIAGGALLLLVKHLLEGYLVSVRFTVSD